MKTSMIAAAAATALVFAASGVAHAQVVNDFDSAGDTAGWTTDRYAPSTFQSGVAYGGRTGTLEEATSVADGANNRPGAYVSSFYNTQGMAFDFAADVTEMSIELYGDPAYANALDDQRIAGFWGVSYDATDSISAYPIIELTKIGSDLTFRGWDSNGAGSWLNLGLPSGFALGAWNRLDIMLDTGTDTFNYSVNGQLLGSVGAGGSLGIRSTILQVHNNTDGIVDTAHWDNLSTGAVPEPGTWALMILGFGGVGALVRRRRAAAFA
ncbi:MAG: PEP-CTERM sorting domain-containing protein [Phenylobacterium sp.]|uniref:PEPxxWA-CTERM sorting domain-containing protein n=1 Tax=Phenylobacterium sp. TaxID=1871053 RepID=UPI0025DB3CC0|nr:PEPxxWA-CTERM sorting domain-containing protein [Phenylobacterium sp.]MBI1200255.1 PEP-CTERM sorting domain-containing protein [Phenylobacterium sp.]